MVWVVSNILEGACWGRLVFPDHQKVKDPLEKEKTNKGRCCRKEAEGESSIELKPVSLCCFVSCSKGQVGEVHSGHQCYGLNVHLVLLKNADMKTLSNMLLACLLGLQTQELRRKANCSETCKDNVTRYSM